jgi:hypothetical protein
MSTVTYKVIALNSKHVTLKIFVTSESPYRLYLQDKFAENPARILEISDHPVNNHTLIVKLSYHEYEFYDLIINDRFKTLHDSDD